MEGNTCIYCLGDTHDKRYNVCYGCSEAMGDIPNSGIRIIDALLKRIEALEKKRMKQESHEEN